VLRSRHGDRLVVLYGWGVAAIEVAPRGPVGVGAVAVWSPPGTAPDPHAGLGQIRIAVRAAPRSPVSPGSCPGARLIRSSPTETPCPGRCPRAGWPPWLMR
jgi:hypothetical protein